MKGKNEDKNCKRNLKDLKGERGRENSDFLQAELHWIFEKRTAHHSGQSHKAAEGLLVVLSTIDRRVTKQCCYPKCGF